MCGYINEFLIILNFPISTKSESVFPGFKIIRVDRPTPFESWATLWSYYFKFNDVYNYCLKSLTNFTTLSYIWYLETVNKYGESRQISLYDKIFKSHNIKLADVSWIRYINNTIFIFIVYISVLFACTYGISSLNYSNNYSELNSTIFSNIDEVEEECGQIEDLITYFSYFLVCVLWFYLFNLFSGAVFMKGINWILLVFWFLLIMGIVIPAGVFKKMGLACSQFVRGSSRSAILVVESLLDLVSLTVIVLRFFLQNIRFIFIFFGFLEYFEFINSKLLINSTFFLFFNKSNYILNNTPVFSKINYILELFSQILLYLYYVGHLTIVYIAQLSIYIALSFWIFFFFYFTFVLARFGNYFKYKRQEVLSN